MDDDMVPLTADFDDQARLSMKPLFAPGALMHENLLTKYSCPNCHNIFQFDYPNFRKRTITSKTQLKMKCPCSNPWKGGKYFCPCDTTNDTEGPIETHFVHEHAKKARIDTLGDSKPELFKKTATCPICQLYVPFSDFLAHLQLDIKQYFIAYQKSFDLTWFRTNGTQSVSAPVGASVVQIAAPSSIVPNSSTEIQHTSARDVQMSVPQQAQSVLESMNEDDYIPGDVDDDGDEMRSNVDPDLPPVVAQAASSPEPIQPLPPLQMQGIPQNNTVPMVSVPLVNNIPTAATNNPQEPAPAPSVRPTMFTTSNLTFLGVTDDLQKLQEKCTFTEENLHFPEIKKLQQSIQDATNLVHNFACKIPKLDWTGIRNELQGENLDFFNLYLKLPDKEARKTSALFSKMLQKANPTFKFKQTYNWFIKTRERLRDKFLWQTTRKETCVGFVERVQKILSSHGDFLQLEKSQNDLDFTNSPCYERCLNYCKKVKNSQGSPIKNVYPLVFLFWKDDWEQFTYSQVNTVGQAGLSFRILNFPFEFQKKKESVFLWSVAKPKIQDIVDDVVHQFNVCFDGFEFDTVKFIPFLCINLADNPERYRFLKRNWWNSSKFPCSHCSVSAKHLPFEASAPFSLDMKYLQGLFQFLPHFLSYEKERDKILGDTANVMPVAQLRVFVVEHQHFQDQITSFRDSIGQRYVKQCPFDDKKVKYFQKLVQEKTMPFLPMFSYSLDIAPFIYLSSYWKGLFPLFLSVPMEPFHTLFNIMKSTIKYLIDYEFLDAAKFKEFISVVNKNKDQKVKFSQDTTMWHGDQYIALLKHSKLWLSFCDCIVEEREEVEKLGVLLSFIRHSGLEDLKRYQIGDKLHDLHIRVFWNL